MSTERAMNAQISEESDDLGDSDSVRCDVYLPIELIQRILFYADEKTLLNCQLVCKSWNQIILNYVWRKKAEIKTGHKFAIKTVLNWKDFYLICAKNLFGRNLLKNHSGAEGFKYWDYIGHRGDSDSESEFEVDDINNDDDHSESESESNTESNNENESNTESENENAANNNNNNQNNRNANGNANENGRNRVNENHSDYETDSSSESDEVIYQDSDDNEDQPDKIRGWMVECPPIGAPPPPSKPEFEGKKHCFVTTFYDCHKKQIIDLLKEGFSANILDQMRPPIAVNFLLRKYFHQFFKFDFHLMTNFVLGK